MSTYRIALVAAAAALALAQAATAATLSGTATPGTTTVGGTGTVVADITVSDPVDLAGATLNLYWEPGLSFNGIDATVFGMSLADFTAQFDPSQTQFSTAPDPAMPGYEHYGVSLLAGVTPPSLAAGPVAVSFSFVGVASGVQKVHVDLLLTDASDFSDIPLTLDSTVTVSPVPEAPPAAMLAAGLGVLALLARRRRS